jgi:hypothetical protein
MIAWGSEAELYRRREWEPKPPKIGVLLLLLAVLVALGMCLDAQGQQWHVLPDAPEVQPEPHTFSFGRFDSPHPLRTNRQTLHSPAFWIPQVATWVAVSADLVRTRNQPYGTSGHPMLHGPGLYADALIPVAVCNLLSYGSDRLLWRPIGWGLAGFVVYKHARAAITQQYP